MNHSTKDVTLLTGFVLDVLAEYNTGRKLYAPAFEMAAGLDPARPDAWCSIDIYNGVCDWIERNVGSSSIRSAGIAIGNRAYAGMVAHDKHIGSDPAAMMVALKWAASTMIRDPEGRGWEIRESVPKRIVMRRTQTFNCVLQEGLLLALIEKAGVLMPAVKHAACTRRNDEFCDYEITWLKDRKPDTPEGAPSRR